jgi:hypothetical protein
MCQASFNAPIQRKSPWMRSVFHLSKINSFVVNYNFGPKFWIFFQENAISFGRFKMAADVALWLELVG